MYVHVLQNLIFLNKKHIFVFFSLIHDSHNKLHSQKQKILPNITIIIIVKIISLQSKYDVNMKIQ